jgi:hypothetical protein
MRGIAIKQTARRSGRLGKKKKGRKRQPPLTTGFSHVGHLLFDDDALSKRLVELCRGDRNGQRVSMAGRGGIAKGHSEARA